LDEEEEEEGKEEENSIFGHAPVHHHLDPCSLGLCGGLVVPYA
jgi:hypothetical protein